MRRMLGVLLWEGSEFAEPCPSGEGLFPMTPDSRVLGGLSQPLHPVPLPGATARNYFPPVVNAESGSSLTGIHVTLIGKKGQRAPIRPWAVLAVSRGPPRLSLPTLGQLVGTVIFASVTGTKARRGSFAGEAPVNALQPSQDPITPSQPRADFSPACPRGCPPSPPPRDSRPGLIRIGRLPARPGRAGWVGAEPSPRLGAGVRAPRASPSAGGR